MWPDGETLPDLSEASALMSSLKRKTLHLFVVSGEFMHNKKSIKNCSFQKTSAYDIMNDSIDKWWSHF